MNDIEQSLQKAMIEKQWILGDKQIARTGNPFEWVDGDTSIMKTIRQFDGIIAFIRWLLVFDELYSPPDEIYIDQYEEVKNENMEIFSNAFDFYAPFISHSDINKNAIEGISAVRTVDYCFIKKYAIDLSEGINHLDLGPGLGSHAVYSLSRFKSNFFAIEAIPYTYQIQRYFFRYLSYYWPKYIDVVECENFYLNSKQIHDNIYDNQYRIKQIPSWYFDTLDANSIDLITATFMLNELSEAGLLWLLSNASKVLKEGSYLYIRDSGKLKPGRNKIDYDKLLEIMGFKLVKKLDLINRVDLHGIPRLYQKTNNKSYSYQYLLDKCFGHFYVLTLDKKIINIDNINL